MTTPVITKINYPAYLGCMYSSLFTYEAIISITSEMEEEDLDPLTCQTACLSVPGNMR